MAQALYRKWRPRTFEEVVGQEHVVRTLRNALTSGRVHHAYLFTGPRGTGKTTTARLLAKAVNCLAENPTDRPCNACSICLAVNEGRLMDLIEIDAASNTGVDDVRELRERVGYRPTEARYKVYVIDEVHMLSNAAFNALLKTLEEPPPHVIFVLATTEPHRIPATVLSRCQRFDFRRVPLTAIVQRLERIAQEEGFVADREALTLIARQATGSVRDAESLLDQLAAYTDGGITVEVVRAALGTGAEEAVVALTDALASGEVAKGLAVINRAVDQGSDPRQFARQMVDHLRGLLLLRLGSDEAFLQLSDEQREASRAQATRFQPQQLARAVRLFSQAATETRAAWQPQLPLELAFVEAALPEGAERPAGGAAAARSAAPRASGTPTASVRDAAPKAAAPRAASATPPSGPGDPPLTGEAASLEEVQGHWQELLSAIRPRNLSLEALLRSGKPVGVEGGMVLIGFAHQFHKGKVEEEANRQIVEETLRQLLGRPVRVRCVLVSVDSSPSRPTSRPVSQAGTQARRPPPPPPPPAQPDDGLVRAAVEKLGARVAKPET